MRWPGRRFLALAAIAAGAVGVAGCGSGGGDDAPKISEADRAIVNRAIAAQQRIEGLSVRMDAAVQASDVRAMRTVERQFEQIAAATRARSSHLENPEMRRALADVATSEAAVTKLEDELVTYAEGVDAGIVRRDAAFDADLGGRLQTTALHGGRLVIRFLREIRDDAPASQRAAYDGKLREQQGRLDAAAARMRAR
jgi:hypothetical protein